MAGFEFQCRGCESIFEVPQPITGCFNCKSTDVVPYQPNPERMWAILQDTLVRTDKLEDAIINISEMIHDLEDVLEETVENFDRATKAMKYSLDAIESRLAILEAQFNDELNEPN